MDAQVKLWEKPQASTVYMLAGWSQWADAGEISSGLPAYLIEQLGAHKIGEIVTHGVYLFQLPGTHHLLRPQIKLVDGHCQSVSSHQNDIYYAQVGDKGLVILLGVEPHLGADEYCDALLEAMAQLHVRRTVAVGGVYGAMPYDKDREISCAYSLPAMRDELENYVVRFSDYAGGATIGTYLTHRAQMTGAEVMTFYGFSPAYEFSQLGLGLQGLRVEKDYRAWYELLARIDYMFDLHLDLSDLQTKSQQLVTDWDERLRELEEEHPELHLRAYLDAVGKDFQERPFIPLDDAWDALGDLLDDSHPED
jgi:proteasome assembly chaperone (PAC2) family protein